MAKKVKTAKAPKERKARVQSSEVSKATPQGKLRSLLAAARSSAKDIGEITGSIREKIAYAVEHDHLHTKAFSIVRSLDRMEPAKLADLLDHLEHYLEVSGLNERAKSAPRMAFGPGEEGEDDDEGTSDQPEGNVTKLRAAE